MSQSLTDRAGVVVRLLWRVPVLLVHLVIGIPLVLLSFLP